MKILIFVFTLVIFFSSVMAADNQSELISKLHYASENIERFINHRSVFESIYIQIRPKANITNSKLSSSQIDEKVRKYVTEKYAPALISNYSLLYSKLKIAKAKLSSCENLNPFSLNKDVLIALCLTQEKTLLRVRYMTNGYDQGWSTSSVYVFEIEEGSPKLSAIELQLKDGVKTYVEGI